ncbi:MAG: hypothetical protein OXP66_02560 [Candidatus Tectomicrobia bacterium]|nr:hypothetical protein [Candidatus Tectomicrobia bacterium]
MISVDLLVAIFEKHGYVSIKHGSVWVFVHRENEEIFAFEDWQAQVGLRFLVRLAEVQGSLLIKKELELIERRLADLNS